MDPILRHDAPWRRLLLKCCGRSMWSILLTKFPTHPEINEWFLEDQAFSQSYDLAPHPPHFPHPLPSVCSTGHTQEDRKRERQVTHGRRGERVGEEPNHMTARKPGPLQMIQYSLQRMGGRESTGVTWFHLFLSSFPKYQYYIDLSLQYSVSYSTLMFLKWMLQSNVGGQVRGCAAVWVRWRPKSRWLVPLSPCKDILPYLYYIWYSRNETTVLYSWSDCNIYCTYS